MVKTLLHSLLNGIEQSRFMLFLDSSVIEDHSLLYTFTYNAVQRKSKTYIFLFEHSEEAFLKKANLTNSRDKVICYTHDLLFKSTADLADLPSGRGNAVEQNVLYVIDSLSAWLYNYHLTTVAWQLQALKSSCNDVNILALLHADCHPFEITNSIKKLATAILSITDEETELNKVKQTSAADLAPPRNHVLICNAKATRKNGKVVTSKEEFSVSKNLIFACKPWTANPKNAAIQEYVDVATLVHQSASFNLSLSQHERVQKDKLVLPYVKAKLPVVPGDNVNEAVSGKIYYEPDEADDFDEEDPDDDLDF